jgi:hypothetical protein
MSTKDQLLYSALHGTAMRYAAERRNLDEAIAELREIADGRDHVLAEAAGITAGSWYVSPATHCWTRADRSRNDDPGWWQPRCPTRLRRAGAVDTGGIRAGNEVTQG